MPVGTTCASNLLLILRRKRKEVAMTHLDGSFVTNVDSLCSGRRRRSAPPVAKHRAHEQHLIQFNKSPLVLACGTALPFAPLDILASHSEAVVLLVRSSIPMTGA